MTKRTITLELTTDEPDETLLDPKLWAKAVGIFKDAVTVGDVSTSDAPAKKAAKTAKKKVTGLKKRASSKKAPKKQ